MVKDMKVHGGVAAFIISIIVSMAAGIGGSVLMFLSWVRVDVLTFSQECSVLQIYNGMQQIIKNLTELEQSAHTLLGQSTPLTGVIEHLESIQLVPLGMLVLAVFIVILQVLYVFQTVFGKGGRVFGILAGLLTIVLGVGAVVLVLGMVVRMNMSLGEVNQLTNDLFSYTLDAGRIIKLTPFPVLSAVLGLVEVIFAR